MPEFDIKKLKEGLKKNAFIHFTNDRLRWFSFVV